jgi:hypothetical protein
MNTHGSKKEESYAPNESEYTSSCKYIKYPLLWDFFWTGVPTEFCKAISTPGQ